MLALPAPAGGKPLEPVRAAALGSMGGLRCCSSQKSDAASRKRDPHGDDDDDDDDSVRGNDGEE